MDNSKGRRVKKGKRVSQADLQGRGQSKESEVSVGREGRGRERKGREVRIPSRN